MSAAGDCNCPPLVDVTRGRAGGTKPPCPVHPEPPNLGDLILPLPRVTAGLVFRPFVVDYASIPLSSANDEGYGTGC